jgi:hypothetical protein
MLKKKVIGIISLGTAIYSGAYLICQYKYMVFLKKNTFFVPLTYKKGVCFVLKGKREQKLLPNTTTNNI